MAEKIKENKGTANINHIAFQDTLRSIIADIDHHGSHSVLKKLMLGKNKVAGHVTGHALADRVPENRAAQKSVKQLHKDPHDSAARLSLVNAVLGGSKDHDIDTHRDLMFQAAIPIYLGDITPAYLQLVLHAYRTYHEKLINLHKQNMMAIKSQVLKNVNMSGIDVSDETHVENQESMLIEIAVAETLNEKVEEIIKNITAKMTTSMSREEMLEVTGAHKAAGGFFGGSESESNQTAKQNMVISKTVQVIEMLKPVPLLMGAGLDMARLLAKVDNKIAFPLVMEGRIYQQMLKYFLLRIESGDKSSRENMAPTFNKSLVAFRKAMKLVSKTAPKKSDLPVLTEFANLSFYGFIHRDLMRFSKDGVMSLVNMGKEAADAAVTVDPSYTPLQKRIEKSINQLVAAQEEAETA